LRNEIRKNFTMKERENQRNKKLNTEIIERINRVYQNKYDTIKDFSIQCDMSESKLCKILSKQQNIYADDFQKIANALDVTYEYLFDGTEKPVIQTFNFPLANAKQNNFLSDLVKYALNSLKEYELK